MCLLKSLPIRKRELSSQDISSLVDLLTDEMKEVSLRNRIPHGDRTNLTSFFKRLVLKRSMNYFDGAGKRPREKEAELFVFEMEATVVGFGILAWPCLHNFKRSGEIVLLVISPDQREKGCGGYLLDFLTSFVLRQNLDVIVHCPADALLMFAMLITRGFVAVGRRNGERLLCRKANLSQAIFASVRERANPSRNNYPQIPQSYASNK